MRSSAQSCHCAGIIRFPIQTARRQRRYGGSTICDEDMSSGVVGSIARLDFSGARETGLTCKPDAVPRAA